MRRLTARPSRRAAVAAPLLLLLLAALAPPAAGGVAACTAATGGCPPREDCGWLPGFLSVHVNVVSNYDCWGEHLAGAEACEAGFAAGLWVDPKAAAEFYAAPAWVCD